MHCLVIEDEVAASTYICNGLNEAGYRPVACLSGDDGLRYALHQCWDIIIVDRMLAGSIDGLTLIEKLRAEGKIVPVIVVSALAGTEDRVEGLKRGADDYLSKPFAFSELLARIEALTRRAATVRQSTRLQVGDLTLDVRAMRVTRSGTPIPLQQREFKLLEYFMRNEGHVVTRSMLLESVWGYHFDPQTNVIDVQISRLRSKIDKEFPQPLLHTVRGVGYRLAADLPDAGA